MALASILLAPICILNAVTSPATQPADHPVHLKVDKQKVTIDAKVCLRSGPLEFLLCKQGTKEHESILNTNAEASNIHAALLVLGLTPGKPATWEIDPLTGNNRAIPPRGAGLKITLHWTDKNGTKRHAQPVDWLKPFEHEGIKANGPKKTNMPKEWIFVGSLILRDERYWADLEGGIISVANFASSVIDVPFRSSNENQLLEFSANTEAIPPDGTDVRVTITPVKGAKKAPHAREIIEIDHNGGLRLHGRKISWEKVSKWAEKYTSQHSRGMVLIRASPYTLVHDVQHLKDELLLGGVRQMEVAHLAADPPPLPRTAAQAKSELQRFEKQLANPEDYLSDPVRKARQRLDQIKAQSKEHRRLEGLWSEYAASLEQLLAEYKSSKSNKAEK